VATTNPRTDVPELVDWTLAARVGRRVAGGDSLPVRAAWSQRFTDLSAVADQAVADFTQLGGSLPAPVAEPLDRAQWVERNLATLRRLLRPLAAKVAEHRTWQAQGRVPAALRASTQKAVGAQAGTLLGYVAQRVLGQYDLPVPADGANADGPPPDGPPAGSGGDGAVWYVVPNIVGLERRHGFKPADFRLWIALHETAHRRQFRGVPWLPGHLHGLIDAYLGSVDVDEELIRRLGRQAQHLARRALAGERFDLLDLVLSGEQREVVDRIQAVMTVLEGHGEFVMERVGARLVPGHEQMHNTLRNRRAHAGAAERLLQELLGLRQKLDQYDKGERFVRRLYQRGGVEAVNHVFAAPDALPSLAEIGDPDRYLARVG
jgi:coenzyme F420 biosynthesis associated uncharacterized protein